MQFELQILVSSMLMFHGLFSRAFKFKLKSSSETLFRKEESSLTIDLQALPQKTKENKSLRLFKSKYLILFGYKFIKFKYYHISVFAGSINYIYINKLMSLRLNPFSWITSEIPPQQIPDSPRNKDW